jgi:LmbE family N-acetylglucosaminyl deacetylase
MSIKIAGATILVLAPHTDDGELGAGASIAKWARSDNSVHYVGFSACETIQSADPKDVLRGECSRATKHLGIGDRNLRVLDFEVRHFARDRQLVLDVMVDLNVELRPDLVLVPSSDDTHQDHFVVADEARRAFKRTRMLGYEVPWNNFRFETTAFVPVEWRDLRAKVSALAEFHSQAGRIYMNEPYQEAQLRFRGVQAGVELAEAFQVLRWYL